MMPGLFDGSDFSGPGRTRRGAPDTSRAAAQFNAAGRPGQVRRVLEYILSCGTRGATSDEVGAALGMLAQSCSARVNELLRAGLVHRTENRRRTRSGAYAAVLVAVGAGPPPGNDAAGPRGASGASFQGPTKIESGTDAERGPADGCGLGVSSLDLPHDHLRVAAGRRHPCPTNHTRPPSWASSPTLAPPYPIVEEDIPF